MLSKRLPMVPPDSSAARMPLPGATSAAFTRGRKNTQGRSNVIAARLEAPSLQPHRIGDQLRRVGGCVGNGHDCNDCGGSFLISAPRSEQVLPPCWPSAGA